jgi:hypothetical protein
MQVQPIFPGAVFVNNVMHCLPDTQKSRTLCLSLVERNRRMARGLTGNDFFIDWTEMRVFGGGNSTYDLLKEAKESGATSVLPFVTSIEEESSASLLGLKYLAVPSKLAYLKLKLPASELFNELGIPTPDTVLLKKGETYTPDKIIGLKPNHGAGGGYRVVQPGEKVKAELDLVIQNHLEITGNPSLQLLFRNGKLELIHVTDQIIRQDHYCGLTYPSVYEDLLLGYGKVLGGWFLMKGMNDGLVGLDFAMTREGPMALDLNPRVTAAAVALPEIYSGAAKVYVDQDAQTPLMGDVVTCLNDSNGIGYKAVSFSNSSLHLQWS